MTWTQEMDDKLRELASSATASTIAALLGITKNAVLGRKFRLGISAPLGSDVHRAACSEGGKKGRASQLAKPKPARATKPLTSKLSSDKSAINSAIWRAPSTTIMDDLMIPTRQCKKLMQLRANSCRWPVGDPCQSGFFYCGATAIEGRAYCPTHWLRAHRA